LRLNILQEVQKKWPMSSKKRALRVPYQSPNQLTIDGFEASFIKELDKNNRWVKMSDRIPWDELVAVYNRKMDTDHGRPPLNGRVVLGAMIIKHLCNFSDRETIEHIRENVYMQYFLGYTGFSSKRPFDASLFVEIRHRLGLEGVNMMNEALARFSGIITDTSALTHKGRVLFDATACPQAISYPTDLNLLSEARQISEGLIDQLYNPTIHTKKPRTYRRIARKEYLHLAQKRVKHRKRLYKAIGKQLRYLRRNLKSIHQLLDSNPSGLNKLKTNQYKHLLVIQTFYKQQLYMHSSGSRSVEDRIVSLHQPHVRPIVRGKAAHNVEFGSKINVSLLNGFCFLDELNWDAFNEGTHLISYIEDYKTRMGYYPEEVLADRIYCNRENRKYLSDLNIKLLAKPLGRPPKVKKKSEFSPGERNPIEGKFGQTKSAYGMNRIAAKLKETSQTWVAMILFVTNLVKLARVTSYVQYLSDTFSALKTTWIMCLKQITGWNHRFHPVNL